MLHILFFEIVPYVGSTFLFIVELCFMVWRYQNWVVHFPVDGHMEKFQFFSLVSKVIYILIWVFLGIYVFISLG